MELRGASLDCRQERSHVCALYGRTDVPLGCEECGSLLPSHTPSQWWRGIDYEGLGASAHAGASLMDAPCPRARHLVTLNQG